MTDQKAIVDAILRDIDNIPPIPDIAFRAIQLMMKKESTADELGRLISEDIGLTANILRLCNSAYYGLPRTVSSLTQAVMYLGFHTVRNLILTCSIRSYYSARDQIYGYEPNGIWLHSVACAITSELICKEYQPDYADQAFTAGLLHDFGQLVLGMRIADTGETIEEAMVENDWTDIKAERSILGISHDLLGAVLAYKWNLPSDLTRTIRFHQALNESRGPHLLTAIVHLADAITLKLGYGIRIPQMAFPLKSSALSLIGLSVEEAKLLGSLAKDRVEEHAGLFLRRGESG